jgi:hypothetical protein
MHSALLAVLAAAATTANPQAATTEMGGIYAATRQQCTVAVSRLPLQEVIASDANLVRAAEQHICTCAHNKLAADTRLREHLEKPTENVVPRAETPDVRRYIRLKLTEAMLVCLASQLDDASKLIAFPE